MNTGSPTASSVGAGEPLKTAEAPPVSRLSLADRWQRFPSTLALWPYLLILTALAAFLRFWRLDFQPYWTDETATIDRIKGTFNFMLGELTNQGFPPGWYALLRWWCILGEKWFGPAAAFSPTWTRTLPALFGTLTIPCVYFLARQFTDRKGSLLVTLLTVVNPYLIYYSRDIKMYAAMWCIATLNMAIFFKWQTTHRHWLWWPLYLLTALAMTLLQEMAWVMVALQLIFLLTRPRLKGLDAPLWLLANGIVAFPSIWWYLNRSMWMKNVVTNSFGGGLDWIRIYTDMSWKTIGSLPIAHILGFLLPTYPPDRRIREWFQLDFTFMRHLDTRSWPSLASFEFWCAVIVAAIMLLGLIPWRGRRRNEELTNSVTAGRWWWIALWLILPMAALAITWIPEESSWYDFVFRGRNPPAIWEPRYLGMLVPAWLLWLAASMRRLPTWPLRTIVILFVVGVCTISSLANHMLYRAAPYNREAAIFMKYYDPKKPDTIAAGSVGIAYPKLVETSTYQTAMGVRPPRIGSWDPPIPDEQWRRQMWEPDQYLEFVRQTRLNPQVEILLLTDRFGDITDPVHPLSNESLGKILGPRWKLVEEQDYRWHYEWRWYIFNVWRTRVWVRIHTPDTAPAPAATQ